MPDGFRYEGGWVNGVFEGEGTATYANGDVYEGMFKDGKREGEGVLRYATGEEASGEWVNGVLTTATPVASEEEAGEDGTVSEAGTDGTQAEGEQAGGN